MGNIYRFLATASAFVLVGAMVLIAWVYNYQASRALLHMTVERNVALDRLVSNALSTRFESFFSEAGSLDGDTIRARPETEEIREAISLAMEGAGVLKVKIYSLGGLILFSSDPIEIGNDYSGSAAFRAASQARISSELTTADRISAFSGEVFNRDVVETYVPRTGPDGRIVGVMELYTDVTDTKVQIDQTTVHLLLTLGAIFAAVYAVLVVGVMRRAIEPIRLASARASEIGPDSAGARLPLAGMPAEIRPLITAINGALARLDRALAAQRDFTANAAHQLLTPLAVLRAHVDTLDNDTVANPVRRDIDAMSDMVRQLLLLAELEASETKAGELETTDIHGAAVEVISMMAPLAVREGKEIALTGAPGPVFVKGSANLLHQALRNLIENALRHAPAATAVEVAVGADGLVKVTDRGEGVPPERREEIFQRFWRGRGEKRSGAGLGLSIVKKIVENVGGEIQVEDTPGGGACFIMHLAPARR